MLVTVHTSTKGPHLESRPYRAQNVMRCRALLGLLARTYAWLGRKTSAMFLHVQGYHSNSIKHIYCIYCACPKCMLRAHSDKAFLGLICVDLCISRVSEEESTGANGESSGPDSGRQSGALSGKP